MAASKLAILSIFLALIFSQIRAESELPHPPQSKTESHDGRGKEGSEKDIRSAGPGSTQTMELDQLIAALEKMLNRLFCHDSSWKSRLSNFLHPNRACPDWGIVIQKMRSEIESLQENGSLVEQQAVKAQQARADKLEKKVDELEQELQSQLQKKEDLESRANKAEEKINYLLSEIENENGSLVEKQARAYKLEKKVDELEQKLQSQLQKKDDLESRANKAEEKINYLLSEIENENGSLVEKQARADKLEKKVDELEQKLQSQLQKKEDLESRANKAEEKINDLLSEIKNVQETVKDLLKTRLLPTKEMEWFAASALLALLIIILFRIFSTLLYKH